MSAHALSIAKKFAGNAEYAARRCRIACPPNRRGYEMASLS
jgi:hypothetical protein